MKNNCDSFITLAHSFTSFQLVNPYNWTMMKCFQAANSAQSRYYCGEPTHIPNAKHNGSDEQVTLVFLPKKMTGILHFCSIWKWTYWWILLVDKTSIWQTSELKKEKDDNTTIWWNYKIIKLNDDKTASRWDSKLTN